MLIDKGYYDYDYEKPKEKIKHEAKPKSNEELNSMLARFGFNTKLRTTEQQSKPLTPNEMQRIAMEEAREKKNKQ